MKASLWSDDEEEDSDDLFTSKRGKSLKGSSPKQQSIFESGNGSGSDDDVSSKGCLFGGSTENKLLEDLLLSNDKSTLFLKTKSHRGSDRESDMSKKTNHVLDLFNSDSSEENDDDDDDIDSIALKDGSRSHSSHRAKVSTSLFGDSSDNDQGHTNNSSYKTMYEQEVVKCDKLKRTIDSLRFRISELEHELTLVKGSTVESSSQCDSRVLRQKNRKRVQAAKQEAKHTPLAPADSSSKNKSTTVFLSEKNCDTNPSPNNIVETDENALGHNCDDISSDNLEDADSTNLECSTTQDSKFISNRQKQILAKQARTRMAAKKRYGKSVNKLDDRVNMIDNDARQPKMTASCRRGSAGGMKYIGGEWVSSSDDDSRDESAELSESDDSLSSRNKKSYATIDIEVEEQKNDEDNDENSTKSISDVLNSEVEQQFLKWCQKQQNIITMIQSMPEIYPNPKLAIDCHGISYSSSPGEVRKAYLRIARHCHPDKQRKSNSYSDRECLIAEKLFSALADAYSAYKAQFDI